MKRPCPFWHDDSKCAMRHCHVESCPKEQIPQGLKDNKKNVIQEDPANRYSAAANEEEDCSRHHNELDYLNKTLSEKAQKDLPLWDAYDDALENFCDIDESDEEAEYVDLLLNPERYTGYVSSLNSFTRLASLKAIFYM